MRRLATAGGFLACILAANYVTTRYGMVPVGFGLIATAGTYFAGASFVLRDAVQDTVRNARPQAKDWQVALWVAGLIVAGALLSYLVSAPFIALASGVAFLASETADLLVYTPLRRKRLRAGGGGVQRRRRVRRHGAVPVDRWLPDRWCASLDRWPGSCHHPAVVLVVGGVRVVSRQPVRA